MKQSEPPLVSVIIPAYNSGPFVRHAVESVFNQTYPCERTEIIVVDDGSTDNTFDVLKEYRGKILYVRQDNKGIASARNKGMTVAKGEIITFLDADDIWHKERLRKVVEKFREKPQAGMVYHPIELIDSSGLIIHNNFYKAYGYKEGLGGWVANEIFSGRIFCGGSSFTFRKSVTDEIFPIPEDVRRGVDYYITAIASCGAPAVYIHEILGKYRAHDSNITMFAGLDDIKKLAIVNKDFAEMRQRVIEKILTAASSHTRAIDLGMLKRRQAKELIFYHFLAGERFKGARLIPALFAGKPPVKESLRGIAISCIVLFMPASLFPELLKAQQRIRVGRSQRIPGGRGK